MKQKEEGVFTTLKLPIITRWASIITFMESIHVNRQALKATVIIPAVSQVITVDIRNTIIDDEVCFGNIQNSSLIF